MGLDVYVGPLTRYGLGDWLTAVQQAAQAQGMEVRMVRAEPDPEDAITDPVEAADAVRSWQLGLSDALGTSEVWPEDAELPYWTDKPDWDGYGGMVLLAAYDEQPDLKPGNRSGFLRRASPADSPRQFHDAPAYKRASANPTKYPTPLAGVEWWLPYEVGPTVFEAPRLTGQPARMGRVNQLIVELELLAASLGLDREEDLVQLRQAGPPDSPSDVDKAGRFGLAVFIQLARAAQIAKQPLLLDY
ncbi:hypothetical protein ABZS29_14825 [Kribbella sp. NPDC005582]|uniref:hypothetical protein n=1 Tax=Kribbella sp. NPDC005582 TaxID=3156893 RepID=UPI0033A242A8